ncbi:relaxase/mobilization nuclease domain-containing protein, partial [Streptomyces ardesiacus]
MVPDVSTGSDTRGLIVYLFGPGRRDEHTDPHIVAAWDMVGAPDPGRDPAATYTQLAKRL